MSPRKERWWVTLRLPTLRSAKHHVLVKTNFTRRFNLIRPFNPLRENNPLAASGKSVAFLRPSRTHKRGGSRSSRTLGAGCDGRVGARDERGRRVRQNRVVLIPRRWDQVCGDDPQAWLKSPVHQGEHVYAVKPLRRECRLLRRTCGDCRLLFLLQAGHGCGQHPAFPAPSSCRRDANDASLGRIRAAGIIGRV
jgi:hypothetical protein